MQTSIWKKRINPWITYPVLALFSFTVVWASAYYYVPKALGFVFPRPFEGNITYVQYNCLCSGSIMLTIVPSTPSGLANQGAQLNLMYFWAADALSRIVDIPGPRIYAFWQIFYPGSAQLLGMYYPMSVPCVAYVGTACSIAGYAQGVLMSTGTSLY